MKWFQYIEPSSLLAETDSTTLYILVGTCRESFCIPDSIYIEDNPPTRKKQMYWRHMQDMDKLVQRIVRQ